jgi:nicotinamide-nucleotide amidase
MLGAAFTDNPGSSEYFLGGVIAYSNEVKISRLKVEAETIERHGAVSEQTAKELAANVRTIFGADYGIGITGIAGPGGGSDDKPVGTVWIAIADSDDCIAKRYVFSRNRDVNRERAVGTALAMLYKALCFI